MWRDVPCTALHWESVRGKAILHRRQQSGGTFGGYIHDEGLIE